MCKLLVSVWDTKTTDAEIKDLFALLFHVCCYSEELLNSISLFLNNDKDSILFTNRKKCQMQNQYLCKLNRQLCKKQAIVQNKQTFPTSFVMTSKVHTQSNSVAFWCKFIGQASQTRQCANVDRWCDMPSKTTNKTIQCKGINTQTAPNRRIKATMFLCFDITWKP